TGRSLANLQNSKTADTDTVALLQMAGDRGYEIPQHRFALLLRELVTLRELSGEMLQRDGGCRRLFVSHGMALLFLKQPARNIDKWLIRRFEQVLKRKFCICHRAFLRLGIKLIRAFSRFKVIFYR